MFSHAVFSMRKSKEISQKGLQKRSIDVTHSHRPTLWSSLCQEAGFHQTCFNATFQASYSCVSSLPHHLYSWSFVKNDSIKPPLLLARRRDSEVRGTPHNSSWARQGFVFMSTTDGQVRGAGTPPPHTSGRTAHLECQLETQTHCSDPRHVNSSTSDQHLIPWKMWFENQAFLISFLSHYKDLFLSSSLLGNHKSGKCD